MGLRKTDLAQFLKLFQFAERSEETFNTIAHIFRAILLDMVIVRRFDSFEEVRMHWQTLENSVDHYPFQSFWYQKLFAENFCEQKDIYLLGIYENDTLLAIGGFERVDKRILFLGMKQVLGGQDVSDYGDILFSPGLSGSQQIAIWQTLVNYFRQKDILGLQLDFVREDSKTYVAFGEGIGQRESSFAKASVDKQEVAPYLSVPSSWEDYVELLSRKDRHELKRKIKRLERQNAFHFCSQKTIKNDFEEFIRLHRTSDEAKEKFMTDAMKQFFWQIVAAEKSDYRIDLCFLAMDNKKVAAIMSFIGQGRALLYNSGFDPEYGYYSVGLILHAYLIKKSIEGKLKIHDFLRGSERYKYALGAKDRQLYNIDVTLT